MIKIIGAILTILSSSLIGYIYGENLKKRMNNLKELERAMYQLKNEIMYGHALLENAFLSVAHSCKSPVNKVFYNISNLLKEGYCIDVYDAFYKSFYENHSLELTKEDIEVFLNFSKTLGELNLGGQEEMFDLTILYLEKSIKDSEENLKKNLKMYRYLGFSIGAMVVLVLI